MDPVKKKRGPGVETPPEKAPGAARKCDLSFKIVCKPKNVVLPRKAVVRYLVYIYIVYFYIYILFI